MPSQKLYNLEEDIEESNNIAEANPHVVAELLALADAMDADLGTEKAGPGCRALGRVENAVPIINPDGTTSPAFR